MKLTKVQEQDKAAIISNLNARRKEVELSLMDYNRLMEKAFGVVEDAVAGYNAVLSEAREFRDETVEDFRAEFDLRSEKWQESEKGEAAQEVIDIWDGIDLDDIKVEAPDELECPDMGHVDELEGLEP